MVRSFPSLFRFTATLLAFGFSATTAGAWYWAEAKLCRDQILDPDSPIVCDSEIHTVPYRALYQRYRLDAGLPGDFNEFSRHLSLRSTRQTTKHVSTSRASGCEPIAARPTADGWHWLEDRCGTTRTIINLSASQIQRSKRHIPWSQTKIGCDGAR